MLKPCTAPDGPENTLLTPKQEAAALALAGGATVGDAARRSGSGSRTIKTWTATSASFRHRVQELRAEMTARALGRLADTSAAAAETMRGLLKAKSETVRLGAARAILELGVRLRESVELEARIARLEGNDR